ncbi:MAG: NAD(P)-dependent alcohol dehydrogenase [Myxococcales bacterium]|nr:NAD(P)-dependent alcohol dehydrogenase [Myxococcales bacterium]
MKAATQDTYGSPDTLRIVEVAAPEPGEREILVQIHASDVTQGDRRLRSGDFPGISWLPGRLMMGFFGPKHRPGTMFAGRVVAVGRGVTRFSVGDDVFGSVDHGAHAELVAMAEDGSVAAMPDGLSYREAAAIPYGAGTAIVFLRDLAKLQAGEHVLILGATGGVGRYAVQLAKALGAEVTAVCSAPNHALARSLGADHVIDYQREDYRASGRRYDVVFDTIGASRFERRVLTETGRYLSLIVTARLLVQMLITSRGRGRKAIAGVAFGSQALTEDVRELAQRGALRPVLDRTFPFAQLAEAHRHVETGRPAGSVIVELVPHAPTLVRASA